MPSLRQVTAREVIAALRRLGWEVVGQRGSHVRLQRPDGSRGTTVPMHKGKTLPRGTVQAILHQTGLSGDALEEAL